MWLTIWIALLLVAMAMAAPWVEWFGAALENRYEPGSVRPTLGEVFRHDHRESLQGLREGGAWMAAALALPAILFGAFAAGGWLQVFLERSSGRSLRRFLWGGSRYFWRFVRLAVATVLLLLLVAWVCHGWPWKTLVLELLCGARDGDLERLASERTAVRLGWLQRGLELALVALVLVWGDYTRTRLALHDARSALWAGICSFALILANPIRTLRPFLLLVLLEAAVVWGVGRLSWNVNAGLGPESGWTTLLLLAFLVQLALVWQTVSRGARYHAAVQVSRVLVPPLVEPDPWARRIGGPGGPQYPIDDSDEYNVSI